MNVDWLDSAIQGPAHAVFGHLEYPDFEFTVDTRVQEDDAAFGPVGFLFFLPFVIITAIYRPEWPGENDYWRSVLSSFLAFFFATVGYNPWLGRLLIVFVVLGAPLMAVFSRHPGIRRGSDDGRADRARAGAPHE